MDVAVHVDRNSAPNVQSIIHSWTNCNQNDFVTMGGKRKKYTREKGRDWTGTAADIRREKEVDKEWREKVYDTCFHCNMKNPDHPGEACPKKHVHCWRCHRFHKQVNCPFPATKTTPIQGYNLNSQERRAERRERARREAKAIPDISLEDLDDPDAISKKLSKAADWADEPEFKLKVRYKRHTTAGSESGPTQARSSEPEDKTNDKMPTNTTKRKLKAAIKAKNKAEAQLQVVKYQAPRKQKQKQNKHRSTRVDPCVHDYTMSLMNPFDMKSNVCVPMFPTRESRKVHVFARGTAETGTLGFGFVACGARPYNDEVAMPADADWPIWSSDSTFIGQSVQSPAFTGVNGTAPNSPHNIDEFTSEGVQYKVVSYGIRVKYLGTELDRGGQVVALHHPNKNISWSQKTFDDMLKLDRAVPQRPKDDGWISAVFRPRDSNDNVYHINETQQKHDLVVAFEAPNATTPLKFLWEMHANYEFVGDTVRGKTPSPSSTDQTARVISGMNSYSSQVIEAARQNPTSARRFIEGLYNFGKSMSTPRNMELVRNDL